jgi:hypothetical protein
MASTIYDGDHLPDAETRYSFFLKCTWGRETISRENRAEERVRFLERLVDCGRNPVITGALEASGTGGTARSNRSETVPRGGRRWAI